METKSIFKSRTVWGGIVVIICQAGHMAGYTITDDDAKAIVDNVTTICTILSGLYTIYGRVKATHKIVPAGANK